MTLKDIAIRNLLRRKAKAVFILAGLIIGVSTVVSIISFIEAMTGDINRKLEKYGANILIVPKTEILPLSYGGLSFGGISFEMREIHEADLKLVRTIKNAGNIAAVLPLILGVIRVNGQKLLLAGVDFEASKVLKPWWKITGSIPDERGALIGFDVARALKIDAGARIKIKGREFMVSGILHQTGSQDDQIVFTHLRVAQSLLGKRGRISMAEVAALCQGCPISDIVKQISGVIPGARVMAIQQVVKGRMDTLTQFKRFSYWVSVVVIIIGSLVVLVTMMGSVRERTQEIGIFRAIGFRRSHVVRIIFLEAGLLSIIAGILGYTAGIGATRLALSIISEGRSISIPIDYELAVGAFFLAVFISIVSSIYPALMAAKLEPNEALRAL